MRGALGGQPCPGSSEVERCETAPAGIAEVGGSNPSPGLCRSGSGGHPGRNDPWGDGSTPSYGDKFYVVGRRDLPPGLRVAQMFHAARQYAQRYPFLESSWYTNSNTIVLLEVPGRVDLMTLVTRARDRGVSFAEFSEPELAGEGPTAVALGPDARRLVSSLPLALKNEGGVSETGEG